MSRMAIGRPAPVAANHSTGVELVLRLTGASLQSLATWAVVHAVEPDAAGVYFRGLVIACGVAALLRAKYELYMAHHLVGWRDTATEIGNGVLLVQLGRRVLLRSGLVCAALLVVTADLDIQAPRLQPVLQTYLPFVLSIPFISLSTFMCESLCAPNNTLLR